MRRRGFVPQQTINRRMAEKDARFALAAVRPEPKPSFAEPVRWCVVCGQMIADPEWVYAMCEDCGKQDCIHGQKLGACDRCER